MFNYDENSLRTNDRFSAITNAASFPDGNIKAYNISIILI